MTRAHQTLPYMWQATKRKQWMHNDPVTSKKQTPPTTLLIISVS